MNSYTVFRDFSCDVNKAHKAMLEAIIYWCVSQAQLFSFFAHTKDMCVQIFVCAGCLKVIQSFVEKTGVSSFILVCELCKLGNLPFLCFLLRSFLLSVQMLRAHSVNVEGFLCVCVCCFLFCFCFSCLPQIGMQSFIHSFCFCPKRG